MAPPKPRRWLARGSLSWILGLSIFVLYVAIPSDTSREAMEDAERDESDADPFRIEIYDVSPHDPYPGSTIAIEHSPSRHALGAFVGKNALPVLVRNTGELVVELPRDLPPGDLKIRVASTESGAFSSRVARSKPYHLRVRAPDYRKVFRNLVGGSAMVLLGIFLLSRGVRESIGLSAARLLTRIAKRDSFVLGLGAMLGALAQTTTGAAGVLAGLTSARVLGLAPAALAFLAAPLGAVITPLAIFGLVEPREGLVLVAIGVVWMVLAENRRSHAYSRVLLGAGFVAFGLQTFRPGLEPFLSDALLWSVLDHARSSSVAELALWAVLGSFATAALHGPAPLIVLVLGVAQATGHFDLRTLLVLLSGSAFGAALAGLITAPSSPHSHKLARLNLLLGAVASLLAFASVDLWVAFTDLVAGPFVPPSHWSTRMPIGDLGLRVLIGFGASQLAIVALLVPVVPHLARWLESRGQADQNAPTAALPEPLADTLRSELSNVLLAQSEALGNMVALALTGMRRHGHAAEQSLAQARRLLEQLLNGPMRKLSAADDYAGLSGAAFTALQLQNTLDSLLRASERMIDARVGTSEEVATLRWDDETLLRSLHRLVAEGLEAARTSLKQSELLDLDTARSREIQINRLEADARGALLDVERTRGLQEDHLHVLEVVGAYEVSGNHIYRLAEILGQTSQVPHLASA